MISSLSLAKLWAMRDCACVSLCFGAEGLDGDGRGRGGERGGWGGGGRAAVSETKQKFQTQQICMRRRKSCRHLLDDAPQPDPPDPPSSSADLICMCMACAARCTIAGSGAPVSSSGPHTEPIVWACRCLGRHAAPSAASRRWGGGPWQEWEESLFIERRRRGGGS